jgi:hypothetical protein
MIPGTVLTVSGRSGGVALARSFMNDRSEAAEMVARRLAGQAAESYPLRYVEAASPENARDGGQIFGCSRSDMNDLGAAAAARATLIGTRKGTVHAGGACVPAVSMGSAGDRP